MHYEIATKNRRWWHAKDNQCAHLHHKYWIGSKAFPVNSKKRFLEHLHTHLFRVITANSFRTYPFEDVEGAMLFDTFSLFNHSCSPNIVNVSRFNEMFLLASRQIYADKELRIGYGNFRKQVLRAERRKEVSSFGFTCECELCGSESEIRNGDIAAIMRTHDFISEDPTRKRNTINQCKSFENGLRRTRPNEREKRLEKNGGHHLWLLMLHLYSILCRKFGAWNLMKW